MNVFELEVQRPKSDKNFARNIMPQIRKNDLVDSPFTFSKSMVSPDSLKPVQNQRVKGMHKKAKRGFKDGTIRPIIIDKDNYIVNGHHRLDIALHQGLEKVKVLKVDATIEELIHHFNHKADDSPTFEQELSVKLEQKLNEIFGGGGVPDYKTMPAYKLKKKKVGKHKFFVPSNEPTPKGVKALGEDKELPKEVQQFVNSLTPDDVGVDTVGEYIIHYEGFTDQCNDGHDDDSIQDVYADVYQDFDNRQGQEALIRGVANDELQVDCNPVLYSVYKNVNERNLNPAVADYVKGKKTKLIKVKVANLDDEAIDDRFGRVIDTDPDVGVDLDNPILLDKDGKTILDGFHRVYQAKRVGREYIPAEIIDENFADGKKKGKSRPGRVKKAGASCKGSVSSLRAKAKKYSGEKGKMYHWCANMKSGRKK